MAKTILLITIHRTNNYGALLQTYAMQDVLSEYGEIQVLDYRNDYVESSLDYVRFQFGVKSALKDLIRIIPRFKAIKKMNGFIGRYFNLVDASDVLVGHSNFDVYICGSDQIWNPACVSKKAELDSNYFASFAKPGKKIISYGSSIGSHLFSPSEKTVAKELLSKFSALSVRESTSGAIVQSIVGKKVNHVLDPTLLITGSKWLELANAPRVDKYILVYTVPKVKQLSSVVGYFKKKLGLKVIAIDQGLYTSKYVDKQFRDVGVEDFLGLFAKAEFVITDSFHGVCFSINFGKKFCAVRPGKHSNRIDDLLHTLDLNSRAVNNVSDLSGFDCAIDYEKVYQCLDESRLRSLKFIHENLS